MIPYIPNRQPIGIPSGGQFAVRHRQEGSVLALEARRTVATAAATAQLVGDLVRRTVNSVREQSEHCRLSRSRIRPTATELLHTEARRAAKTTAAAAVAVGELVKRSAGTVREHSAQRRADLRPASERARLAAAGVLLLASVHAGKTGHHAPARAGASMGRHRHRQRGSVTLRDARFAYAAVMGNAKDARIAVGNLVGRTIASVRARAAKLFATRSTVSVLSTRARFAVAGVLLATAASLTAAGGATQHTFQTAPDLPGTAVGRDV